MNNNLKLFRTILIVSIFVKIIAVLIFYEEDLRGEWLILFNNFEKFKMFSYYTLESQNIPTSYMPPLYFMFLYMNKLLSFNLFNFIYLVYFSQILISTISVILFNKICLQFFNKKISLIGTAIFAFFPLLIFSNALISSACIQIFFYLLFINFSLKVIGEKKKINILLFSLICSSCLLLRGEFVVIFILTLIFFLFLCKNKIKFSILLLLSTLLIISPYLLRNYNNTGKLHIINVSGYALWKGNNHLSKIEGYAYTFHPNNRNKWPNYSEFDQLYNNLDNIKINNKYEINRDKIFFNEAKKNILENKTKYFILYLKKVASYYFIDTNSTLNNYYNPLHIIPVVLLAILALPGLIIGVLLKKNKKFIYLSILMFSLIFLISIFFILPRYKITIIGFQIIFSLYFIEYVFNKFKRK